MRVVGRSLRLVSVLRALSLCSLTRKSSSSLMSHTHVVITEDVQYLTPVRAFRSSRATLTCMSHSRSTLKTRVLGLLAITPAFGLTPLTNAWLKWPKLVAKTSRKLLFSPGTTVLGLSFFKRLFFCPFNSNY